MREAKLTLPELSEKKAKGERLAMVAVGEAMSCLLYTSDAADEL